MLADARGVLHGREAMPEERFDGVVRHHLDSPYETRGCRWSSSEHRCSVPLNYRLLRPQDLIHQPGGHAADVDDVGSLGLEARRLRHRLGNGVEPIARRTTSAKI